MALDYIARQGLHVGSGPSKLERADINRESVAAVSRCTISNEEITTNKRVYTHAYINFTSGGQ